MTHARAMRHPLERRLMEFLGEKHVLCSGVAKPGESESSSWWPFGDFLGETPVKSDAGSWEVKCRAIPRSVVKHLNPDMDDSRALESSTLLAVVCLNQFEWASVFHTEASSSDLHRRHRTSVQE